MQELDAYMHWHLLWRNNLYLTNMACLPRGLKLISLKVSATDFGVSLMVVNRSAMLSLVAAVVWAADSEKDALSCGARVSVLTSSATACPCSKTHARITTALRQGRSQQLPPRCAVQHMRCATQSDWLLDISLK